MQKKKVLGKDLKIGDIVVLEPDMNDFIYEVLPDFSEDTSIVFLGGVGVVTIINNSHRYITIEV